MKYIHRKDNNNTFINQFYAFSMIKVAKSLVVFEHPYKASRIKYEIWICLTMFQKKIETEINLFFAAVIKPRLK